MKPEHLYHEDRANVKKKQKGDPKGKGNGRGGKAASAGDPYASSQSRASRAFSGRWFGGPVLLFKRCMELARGHESVAFDPSELGVAFSHFRIAMLCRSCPHVIPFRIQLSAPGGPRGTLASVADGECCAHSG